MSMTRVSVSPWNRTWDLDSVVWAVRDMHKRGEHLNPQAVRKSSMRLYLAAHRYCGGWAEALRMAGIDPASVYLRKPSGVDGS